MAPEMQLGFVSAVALFSFFMTPYVIKRRIDNIKYDCHESRPVVQVETQATALKTLAQTNTIEPVNTNSAKTLAPLNSPVTSL